MMEHVYKFVLTILTLFNCQDVRGYDYTTVTWERDSDYRLKCSDDCPPGQICKWNATLSGSEYPTTVTLSRPVEYGEYLCYYDTQNQTEIVKGLYLRPPGIINCIT